MKSFEIELYCLWSKLLLNKLSVNEFSSHPHPETSLDYADLSADELLVLFDFEVYHKCLSIAWNGNVSCSIYSAFFFT